MRQFPSDYWRKIWVKWSVKLGQGQWFWAERTKLSANFHRLTLQGYCNNVLHVAEDMQTKTDQTRVGFNFNTKKKQLFLNVHCKVLCIILHQYKHYCFPRIKFLISRVPWLTRQLGYQSRHLQSFLLHCLRVTLIKSPTVQQIFL